ncbi:Protein Ycf2 [Bienertia sinuspersici]
MKGQQFKSRIFELRAILREIKNSNNFLDSWTQFNQQDLSFQFFSTTNVLKILFDPRICSILLSRNS